MSQERCPTRSPLRDVKVLLVFSTLLAVAFLTPHAEGKVYSTRCQLAKELLKMKFQRTFISNWVCLIEHESEKNTSKVVKKSHGVTSYGLFQINSKKWCKEGGKRGGECNIACESLLNDDITDDSICAQKIFELEGFKFWSGWVNKCKGQRLPDISKCPDFQESVRASPDKDRIRKLSGGSGNHSPPIIG